MTVKFIIQFPKPAENAERMNPPRQIEMFEKRMPITTSVLSVA